MDRQGKALMPCTEKHARLPLARARALVHKRMPFVIRLIDRNVKSCAIQLLEIMLDPDSKSTGVAVVRASAQVQNQTGEVKKAVHVQTSTGLVQGISYRCCTVVQRADGYGSQQVANMDAIGTPPKQGTLARSALSLPTLKGGVFRAK